ncbi:hypothetical protein, partial [Pseudomonas amygdali]|uniref:hypothetical protein n=1 Tax=Pseudomonas amygdali TaxID=47877 RepID=UPI001F1C2CF9
CVHRALTLHVLAYNLKRMMSILSIAGLLHPRGSAVYPTRAGVDKWVSTGWFVSLSETFKSAIDLVC